MSLMIRTPLTGISATAFQHPADAAATAALRRIPLFDQLVRTLAHYGYERALLQQLLANGVRIGESQLPALWASHVEAYARLDLDTVPELYMEQSPLGNAMTIGADRPVVVVESQLVAALSPEEHCAVLAHEAGHVLAEHVRYRTTLQLLLQLGASRLPSLGRLPLEGLTLALLEWSRATELSCDRAAAVACGNPMLVCRSLMSLAGGVPGLNVDAFVQQAADYSGWDSLFDRRRRFLTGVRRSHPYAVTRVGELTRWVRDGEFDRIMAGDYVRRGEEPPASSEFRRAVEHYTTRFTETVESTGVALSSMSHRIQDFLRDLRGATDTDETVDMEAKATARSRKRPRSGTC